VASRCSLSLPLALVRQKCPAQRRLIAFRATAASPLPLRFPQGDCRWWHGGGAIEGRNPNNFPCARRGATAVANTVLFWQGWTPLFVSKEEVVVTRMVVAMSKHWRQQELAVNSSKRAGGRRRRTQQQGGGDVAARWAGGGRHDKGG
jgi:hypothetical protein